MSAERLREIAAAAKGHWGYDPQLVADWAASVEFPAEKELLLAERDGRVVGWASVIDRGEACRLEDLWVEPAAMGAGVGRELFEHACARARELGAARLEWEAEPHALGFYERMGGRYVRDGEPSEWGRVLQVLAVDL